MSFNILEIILLVFFAALFVTVIFRQLKLSVILGYLLVGALVGPHAFGMVPDSPTIKQLADFGIVFLMFTVGLEFSLPKLISLRYPVFVIGGSQVVLCVIITTMVGNLLGMTDLSALVVGSIVAMSSTAIVIKQLNDQMELHSPHGLNALGILLFQDLAVIPLIILIAGLKNSGEIKLGLILLWAFAKGVVAIFLIFSLGRWLLRPLFHLIAKTKAIELFTLTVLLVTLSAAWLTNQLGLSFALGAFLAGMMLAETEFRHQIEVEIRPFRDILLGLFFVTIGMLTDVSYWHLTWMWILLLLSALVLGKMFLIILLTRASGNNMVVATRTGLVLAQGGEFGFAILTLALREKILPMEYSQVILAALLISIAIAPLLVHFNKAIATFFLTKNKIDEKEATKKISVAAKKLKNHIIICGYGRVGQHLARVLDKTSFPYIALDLDSKLVQRASLAGENVIFGDPANPGILKAAGIDHAKVLVISFNGMRSATKILNMVKHSYPDLPILVRCHDERELKLLKKSGATQVIAELFEESLTLSHHLLNTLEIAAPKIAELIQEVRSSDYDILQRVFTGTYDHNTMSDSSLQQLRPILLSKGAYAIGRTLKEFYHEKSKIEVVAIRRGNTKQFKPHAKTRFHVKDILIVHGTIHELEKFEGMILFGEF